MKVLYIDGVGPFGGASRSLYEAVRALPAGSVDAYFVAQRGSALDFFYSEVATDVISTRGLTRFENTRFGYYRGVRWLVLLRELSYVPFTIIAIFRARKRWKKFDVIHANEITEILPLLLAKYVFGAPALVHVRSSQRVGRSWRCRWLHRCLRRSVAAVVAIDENVRSTLPGDIRVDVIHNSFTPKRAQTPDPEISRKLQSLRPMSLKIGFVGNLHRSKGLMDLLDAAKIVREAGREVEFIIVGGNTRNDRGLKGWLLRKFGFAQSIQAELRERIEQYGLTDIFHLFGPTTDIQCVYEGIDVVCFPSHYDDPGRPVFEAAFSSVPCIAAVTCPRSDTLIHRETGLAVPMRDPARLAAAILYFADNRGEVQRMGANARELANRNFNPSKNAQTLLSVYSRIVNVTASRLPSK